MKKREIKQRAKLETLLVEERRLWGEGKKRVAGLDEAGAGPLAGPVYAACVVLNPEADTDPLLGVDDSKKLSAEKREALALAIKTHALAWAVAEATVEEIDRINILRAGLLAMARALEAVRQKLETIDFLLLDARELIGCGIPQAALIKGDGRCLSIAAASILAKTSRDQFMVEAALRFPDHGFDKHKGYGTAEHMAALRNFGVTPLHRRSFEPIQSLIEPPAQLGLFT